MSASLAASPRARSASQSLRVVVADDHPLFRDGLVAALAMIDGVEVVGTAADGEQAISSPANSPPTSS